MNSAYSCTSMAAHSGHVVPRPSVRCQPSYASHRNTESLKLNIKPLKNCRNMLASAEPQLSRLSTIPFSLDADAFNGQQNFRVLLSRPPISRHQSLNPPTPPGADARTGLAWDTASSQTPTHVLEGMRLDADARTNRRGLTVPHGVKGDPNTPTSPQTFFRGLQHLTAG